MTKADFKIKIFADGADLKGMLDMYRAGFISGFTTNPTLMKKAGVKDYKAFAKEVLENIKDLPVSFECFSDDFDMMEKEAREIHSWGSNVYVKIPITNTQGESSVPLIKKLSAAGFKINVTAMMTLTQVGSVLDVLTPGAGTYISVFAGRIANTGVDPEPVMRKASEMAHKIRGVETLWASCRELFNIYQAQRCGVDIITVTNDILAKMPGIGKDLNQFSLETVRMFYNDARSSGFKII
jgi:transaldolase